MKIKTDNPIDGMKLTHTGTLKIVSSGYNDRYVLSIVHLNIECDGITYRIDNDDDRVPAILKLAGMELTPDNIKTALHAIHSSKWALWGEYDTGAANSHITGSVMTTNSRLTAGIAAATNYRQYNDYGRATHEPIAATLTEKEWQVVKTGLERINKLHAELGKPVVDFTIPEVGR